MRSRNERIVEWAVGRAGREFKNDVAIMALYGSFVNATSNPLSDVDFFFIPKTGRGYEMSKTFIVEGIGFDLFPMSWARVAGLSELKEPLAPLLGDSVVAYSDSDEDLGRFMELRAKLFRNVADGHFMHARAVDAFNKVLSLWEVSRARHAGISVCRKQAGMALMLLSDAVAYENGTYYHKGLKKQYDDLAVMQRLPDGFLEGYDAIIRSADTDGIMTVVANLISSCGAFLGLGESAGRLMADMPESRNNQTEGPTSVSRGGEDAGIDYSALVSFYEEALSSFNKIYWCCKQSVMDYRLAFISAVCLQKALDEEVPGMEFDLLGDFDHADLGSFSSSVAQSEARLVSYITRGAVIRRYLTFEDFLAADGS